MVINPSARMIAQRQVLIGATQQRVWDLMAMVIYQQLPLEQVDIVSLGSFNAVLKWRVGFISLAFHVEGTLLDIFRPSSYGCIIFVKQGPIRLGIRVAITLKPIDENQTEVICTAMEEGKITIPAWFIKGKLRNFSLTMFDSIGARLQQLCS